MLGQPSRRVALARLALDEQNLGADNPRVAFALTTLGRISKAQDDPAEAEQRLRRAMNTEALSGDAAESDLKAQLYRRGEEGYVDCLLLAWDKKFHFDIFLPDAVFGVSDLFHIQLAST